MAKKPSAETELRNLKRQMKEDDAAFRRVVADREAYRARATKAEQEAAEWKRRFDALLNRTSPLVDAVSKQSI